ncbi:MAG: hypothetical protein O6913_06390 [Chloroflexi bacterium]|nr:hypothetical protein [Chloroflexota bacterium]MCZ6706696.1 hypothetical protein [Chloroflexota bacterium]
MSSTSDAKPDDSAPDPAALWKDWLAQAEHQWSEFVSQSSPKGALDERLTQLTDMYRLSLQNTNELMSRMLETWQVPTREDVLALSERLAEIEARLSNIEDSVMALTDEPRPPDRPAPRRTKQPPAED